MKTFYINKGVINRHFQNPWIVFLFLMITPQFIYCSQDTLPVIKQADPFFFNDDSDIFSLQDSLIKDRVAQTESKIAIEKDPFKPNPKKAWITAAIFPGAGQIYNRQYWKLPIVYGGFMACAYAISWNNRTYQDYRNAYISIKNDAKNDPQAEHPETWSDNWLVFVPSSIDPATRLHNTTFHSNLKRGNDYYRRYRDLSIIITVGIHLICMADAFVDAQMFDFDVSPDLSFQVTPFFTPETFCHSRAYGINICMNF